MYGSLMINGLVFTLIHCTVIRANGAGTQTRTQTHTLPYLIVDLIKQGKQEGVEVSQEEGKDASQLPLEGNPGMIVFQLSNGFKQRRTHQTQQRHDDLQLSR